MTEARPSLVLYQPDIPQNAGAMLRLAACMGIEMDIINPCGFVWDDKRIRRSGMDYLDKVQVRRYDSFDAYKTLGRRIVLLTTKADFLFQQFRFLPGDAIMVGRESAGVPDAVAEQVHARIRIPMMPGLRSLNVAISAGIAVSEALRQLNCYPEG